MNLKLLLVATMIVSIGKITPTGFKSKFLPNLPAGEYRIKHKYYSSCEPTDNHLLKFNIYLSRKSPTVLEVKGNQTFLIPFDNSLTMNVNFAVKGINGGWIDNAHVYSTKNACDNNRSLMGKSWKAYAEAFKIPNAECPVKPGVYVSSGFHVDAMNDNAFPKQFFYGEYKITVKYTNDKKEMLGCVQIVADFVRPWEV